MQWGCRKDLWKVVGRSRNLNDKDTIITGTRYGNVMASRGSVIPLFLNK